MFKRINTYRQKRIDKAVTKQMRKAIEQIAEEAQTAVKQIRAEIEPQVAVVTEVFLKDQIGEVQKMTQDNLQMFQTTLQVMNASHANHKALLKILEPYTHPNGGSLTEDVEKMGFKYQVDLALTDLDTKRKENAHPAILQHVQSKIGQLYQEAQNKDWLDLFNAAVQEHSRNWLEGFQPTHTPEP
jgi:hypothetical protein